MFCIWLLDRYTQLLATSWTHGESLLALLMRMLVCVIQETPLICVVPPTASEYVFLYCFWFFQTLPIHSHIFFDKLAHITPFLLLLSCSFSLPFFFLHKLTYTHKNTHAHTRTRTHTHTHAHALALARIIRYVSQLLVAYAHLATVGNS